MDHATFDIPEQGILAEATPRSDGGPRLPRRSRGVVTVADPDFVSAVLLAADRPGPVSPGGGTDTDGGTATLPPGALPAHEPGGGARDVFAGKRAENRRREKEAAATRADKARRAHLAHRRLVQHTHAATIRNKEANRAMREALASREAKREGAFAHHCGSLSDGAKLADAIGARLEVFEAADRAKYRQQFEQWNEKVYGKITADINQQVEAMGAKALNAKRRAAYQDYLDVAKAKPVFRDIIVEDEYDPFDYNRTCVRSDATRGDEFVDPVKRSIDKLHTEKTMMLDKDQLALLGAVPLGRTSDLRVQDWHTGKIESTPHGLFTKMMEKAEAKLKEGNKSGGARENSSYMSKSVFRALDQYAVDRSRETLDSEFPKGRRTRPNL